MHRWLPDLPKGGWTKVVIATGATTLVVCALATIGTLIANGLAMEETTATDYYASVILAGILTVPLFGSLMVKLVQLHEANGQLHTFATIDSMTGALNRRAFLERVETRLAASRAANCDAALFVIDVDHFKWINDRFGHQIGDVALARIAGIIRANLRDSDIFGRLGGEEFGAYLEGIPPAAALEIAERCRIAIRDSRFAPEDEPHALSVSIGIAFPDAGSDLVDLYKTADERLYVAKTEGRDRIEPRLRPRAA